MGVADDRIPEDQLPECWSDEVRMNALFAPFRPKASNPESWSMKMKFWSDMLTQWCKHKKDPIVSAADAKVAFQRRGRTPACLDIVVEELLRNNQLVPLSKYQQILHSGRDGWLSWTAKLAFRPAALALTAVAAMLPSRQAVNSDGMPAASIHSTERYVLLCVLEEKATELLAKFPPGEERVGTIEDLMERSGYDPSLRETFEVMLGWLVSKDLAVKQDDVVKLSPSVSVKASPITSSERALSQLLVSQRALAADERRLQAERSAAERDARSHALTGNRLAAKRFLRRKHQLTERLDKCSTALENVRQLIHNMRGMEINKHVVDTYRLSSEAMKQEMNVNGISVDNVHDTMDDLKEVLDTYNELEKTLAGNLDETDITELEDELKELLSGGDNGGKEESKAREKDEPLSLPSPPQSSIRRSPKISEREFVFDGEARVLAELSELGSPSGTPRPQSKPSKQWYPPANDFAADQSLDKLNSSFAELRMDERLHPGQKLSVDFSRPPQLYGGEFQVQDHKLADGVWLYNDRLENNLATSTEYCSSESPGKQTSPFGMAPGCERKKQSVENEHSDELHLQQRLDNLRKFN